jgi:hypothetical protein
VNAPFPSLPRHPLAASVVACLVVTGVTTPCFATNDNVLNCNDGGPGSLRDTVANAGNGDSVILNPTNMHCSKITLTGGEIPVTQDSLTVKYNADNGNQFSISGNYSFYNPHARVFRHSGGGKLTLQRLDMSDGGFGTNGDTASVLGGCVDSAGVVDLEYSTVSNCYLSARLGLTFFVRGAGVYAAKGLVLNHSRISYNQASNFYSAQNNMQQPGAAIEGVGAFANNYVRANYSTVSGNYAYSVADNSAGGGLFVNNANAANSSLIQQCTISGNSALRGGGILAENFGGAFTLENSTLSGNTSHAQDLAGQAYARGTAIFSFGALTIRNSTIAFNSTDAAGSPALFLAKPSYAAGFVSTIIANNTTGGANYSVSSKSPMTVSGAYNLIQASSPSITFSFAPKTADPLLQPLADNGGPTLTHAFRRGSPVFGSGVRIDDPPTDQRGAGFPRQAANGDVDIGAYQEQIRDRIFVDGFE